MIEAHIDFDILKTHYYTILFDMQTQKKPLKAATAIVQLILFSFIKKSYG
jgi:hypothetical protein